MALFTQSSASVAETTSATDAMAILLKPGASPSKAARIKNKPLKIKGLSYFSGGSGEIRAHKAHSPYLSMIYNII